VHVALLVAPTLVEYMPTGHSIQNKVWLFAPEVPEYEPAWHDWHVELLEALRASENDPAGHSKHEESAGAPSDPE
jgi:hypothetical protein